MTSSLPFSAIVKQYLPALYFIGVFLWTGIESQSIWLCLISIPFIIQLILNNRYLNLVLGFVTIVWSLYMAFTMFVALEKTTQYVVVALFFTVVNLYMSRMLFLNQNFTMPALRENSLDETLFI